MFGNRLSLPCAPKPDNEEIGDVDENAPKTLGELAELTALPEPFLAELEGALWAKQQAILVGPPGTSKTYLARQFARYFVRQRPGQPQGSFDVLYMHANWTYEDFFEGLKPTSKDGSLTFEPRMGFFLKWVEGLKDYSGKASARAGPGRDQSLRYGSRVGRTTPALGVP